MPTCLLILSAAPIAVGNPGEQLQPGHLWTAWEFDPGVVVPLAVTAFLYYLGVFRSRSIPRGQIAAFTAGWLSLVVALVSPLHPLGESLFSAHMVQHEILMLISAPLLVLGRPLVPFLWALPFSWRRALGHAAKIRPIQSMWSTLTTPAVAWTVDLVVLWGWHIPVLFNKTLTSDFVHAAQHISFLFASLLFWWAVLQHRASYGTSVLYIFTTAVHSGALGALLTLSPHIWYPGYVSTTETWGLTPLEDQQLGGLIMWVPSSIVYIAAGLWLFSLWMSESGFRMAEAHAHGTLARRYKDVHSVTSESRQSVIGVADGS
jgi:cytochrome c oxidase assembly factor CtaG